MESSVERGGFFALETIGFFYEREEQLIKKSFVRNI
jgi:hypothetical protein